MTTTKFLLPEDRIPTTWYNVVPDLPNGLPPMLHPATKEPITEADLEPLFPAEVIAQEFATAKDVDIPGAVLDIYRQWQPSPLIRARRLEKALDTPARIYFKYEGVSPVGSHKPNTAVPQAYYNKQAGVERRSPPRPGPGSGAVPSRSPAPTSASPVRSTWSRSATSRSRTGAG